MQEHLQTSKFTLPSGEPPFRQGIPLSAVVHKESISQFSPS